MALVMLMVLIPFALIALTAFGAHRRGQGNACAVVSGVALPITWAAWYLLDKRASAKAAPTP